MAANKALHITEEREREIERKKTRHSLVNLPAEVWSALKFLNYRRRIPAISIQYPISVAKLTIEAGDTLDGRTALGCWEGLAEHRGHKGIRGRQA
jgi:hypothetical protein